MQFKKKYNEKITHLQKEREKELKERKTKIGELT